MKQLLLLITFLYCTLSYSQCGNRYVDSLFEVEKNTYTFGQVRTNNRLVFIAKNIVELSGGFEVGINSTFEIKVNDVSPCY